MAEIMVVLVIVGVMSAIAVPTFRRWQAEGHLEATAQKLLADLRLVKANSHRSGIRHFLLVSPGAGKVTWAVVQGKRGESGLRSAPPYGDTLLRDSGQVMADTLSLLPSVGAPVARLDSAGNNCRYDISNSDTTAVTVPGSWARTTKIPAPVLVTGCGKPEADIQAGILYLKSPASDNVQYAIAYVDWGASNSIQPRLWRWRSGSWEER